MIDAIGGFFTGIGHILGDVFEGTIFVIKAIGTSLDKVPQYIGYVFPAIVVSLLVTAFTVVLVFRVTGKQ